VPVSLGQQGAKVNEAPVAAGSSWHTGIDAGRIAGMKALRKVTVVLPDDLVNRARRASGLGLAPTIRQGLELVAAREAYTGLRRLRGKLKLKLDLARLREDR
jgi:hypothetical protein